MIDMEFFSKGQGATEYLVLLAVVLIVALVSIALLGFFPGLATDAKITQSTSYWKETRPISIQEYVIPANGTATLVMQNVDASGTYTITGITLGGNGTSSLTTTFAPGETKTVGHLSSIAGTAGSIFDLNVTFNYSTPSGVTTTFYGAKNLVGKYS